MTNQQRKKYQDLLDGVRSQHRSAIDRFQAENAPTLDMADVLKKIKTGKIKIVVDYPRDTRSYCNDKFGQLQNYMKPNPFEELHAAKKRIQYAVQVAYNRVEQEYTSRSLVVNGADDTAALEELVYEFQKMDFTSVLSKVT